MTAIDLTFIFFLVATFVKIVVDFAENDKKASEEARVRTTRKAYVSPETMRRMNRPATARAVRTSLRSAPNTASRTQSINSAI